MMLKGDLGTANMQGGLALRQKKKKKTSDFIHVITQNEEIQLNWKVQR